MTGNRLRLPLALMATVAVAEGAVLLLRPREGVLEPAPVSARSYFSAGEIERARAYNHALLALYGVTLLVQGGLLIAIVRRPPARLRGPFRRPISTAAVAGAALSLGLGAATLPLAAISRQRSVDVGLVTQSWGGWAADVAKSSALGAGFAAAGGALLIGLMRRFGRAWWAPGSVLAVALGAGFLYAGPVVLDPLFNRFTRLPDGQVRSDVVDLARRAHVKVGQVYEVDASRRTTAANAYVTGLGATKRVVLYDTLIEHFSRDERRLVVAHELGHVHYRDVPRGLLYLALVAPAALFGASRLTERVVGRDAIGTPRALPAAALSVALVAGAATTVSNQLSRRIEARADTFSLTLTGSPAPFVSFERRIALRNVADPQPAPWVTALLATHPPTLERIGAAVAYERGERPRS